MNDRRFFIRAGGGGRRILNSVFPVCATAVVLAGCRLLPPPPTVAQTVERIRRNQVRFDETGELSLEAAQRIALRNNPDYRSSFLAVDAARMACCQALAAYSPQISAYGNVGQALTENRGLRNPPDDVLPNENHFGFSGGLRGTFLLFDGFARELHWLAADTGVRIAGEERKNIERILKRSVAYAYWDILLAQSEQRIAAANLSYQRSNLEQAEARFRAGHISRSGFLNFRIMLSNAQSRQEQAEDHFRTAQYVLAHLLGFPDGELSPGITFPPLSPDETVPPVDAETCIDMALDNRPDLAALAGRAEEIRFRKWTGLSGYLPRFSAYGDLSYTGNLYRYPGSSPRHRGWNAAEFAYGINADWLLFDGFRHYNQFRRLEALERQALLLLDGGALRAINEIRIGFENLRTSRILIRNYRENLEFIREQRNLVTVEFWAGNVTVTRLNEAQNELIAAESRLAIEQVKEQKYIAQLAAAANVDSSVISGR